MEAIKYIVVMGELLTERLLTYDVLSAEFRTVKLSERIENCPVCETHLTITKL
jgi:molybdopterin/thiamine biosynthesis adenylyltransferase